MSGHYTGDAAELLEGTQRAVVVPMAQPEDGRPMLPAGTLCRALGVPLNPWLAQGGQEAEGGRVQVSQPDACVEELVRGLRPASKAIEQ